MTDNRTRPILRTIAGYALAQNAVSSRRIELPNSDWVIDATKLPGDNDLWMIARQHIDSTGILLEYLMVDERWASAGDFDMPADPGAPSLLDDESADEREEAWQDGYHHASKGLAKQVPMEHSIRPLIAECYLNGWDAFAADDGKPPSALPERLNPDSAIINDAWVRGYEAARTGSHTEPSGVDAWDHLALAQWRAGYRSCKEIVPEAHHCESLWWAVGYVSAREGNRRNTGHIPHNDDAKEWLHGYDEFVSEKKAGPLPSGLIDEAGENWEEHGRKAAEEGFTREPSVGLSDAERVAWLAGYDGHKSSKQDELGAGDHDHELCEPPMSVWFRTGRIDARKGYPRDYVRMPKGNDGRMWRMGWDTHHYEQAKADERHDWSRPEMWNAGWHSARRGVDADFDHRIRYISGRDMWKDGYAAYIEANSAIEQIEAEAQDETVHPGANKHVARFDSVEDAHMAYLDYRDKLKSVASHVVPIRLWSIARNRIDKGKWSVEGNAIDGSVVYMCQDGNWRSAEGVMWGPAS